MDEFIQEAHRVGLRSIQLETDVLNTPAQRIYLKAGFRITRELVNLGATADALAVFPSARRGRAPKSAPTVRPAEQIEAVRWYLRDVAPSPVWERQLTSLLLIVAV